MNMMNSGVPTAFLLSASIAAGCGSLEPRVPEADPSIPDEWPLPPTTASAPASVGQPPKAAAAVDIGWRDFFVDPKLEELIARTLANNRDLRAAVLTIESARAQFRIQRSERVPAVNLTASIIRSGGDVAFNPAAGGGGFGGIRGAGGVGKLYSVDFGVAGFELDLFGRVRSLSHGALERYLAQEASRRSVQIGLIAEVATAYLTFAADQEQLRLSNETLRTYESSHELTLRRHEFGAVSALDVQQSRTAVEGARSDVATYAGQVARDLHLLSLLVGEPIDATLLPTSFEDAVTGLDTLPAELPSEVLLRRPDVLEAEHLLRAANADIGAARAAFFPSIILTGSVGKVSPELSNLFSGDTDTWSFTPSISIPIFQGGRLLANLDLAHSQRGFALAQYERAIQSGFREVADALSLTETLSAQRQAQESLVDAATRAERLSHIRYERGRDSYLVLLDAQRTLYGALGGLLSTRLAEQSNRVTLYRVLGGGWNEHTQ